MPNYVLPCSWDTKLGKNTEQWNFQRMWAIIITPFILFYFMNSFTTLMQNKATTLMLSTVATANKLYLLCLIYVLFLSIPYIRSLGNSVSIFFVRVIFVSYFLSKFQIINQPLREFSYSVLQRSHTYVYFQIVLIENICRPMCERLCLHAKGIS